MRRGFSGISVRMSRSNTDMDVGSLDSKDEMRPYTRMRKGQTVSMRIV
jgi:hypothetical protein